MPAINANDTSGDQYFSPQALNMLRVVFLLLAVLGSALLLACAPSSSQSDGEQRSSGSASGDAPELTDDVIRERINFSWVRQVPEESGAAEPISWSFSENEPKEITIMDKQIEGSRATVLLDIKTRSAPRARSQRYLAGQIRTEWALKTGWVLRKWEIVDTENISMKYKNLPKPPAENSNR